MSTRYVPDRLVNLTYLRSGKPRPAEVSLDGWCASATSCAGTAEATPTRSLPKATRRSFCRKGDLYGVKFPSSDAAFAAMRERGYCGPHRTGASWPVRLRESEGHWSVAGDHGSIYAEERREVARRLGLPHFPRDPKRRKLALYLHGLREEARRRNAEALDRRTA